MSFRTSILLWLFPLAVYAQEPVTLSGKVTDKATGNPLSDVIVTVRQQASLAKTINFTRTAADGTYSLQFKAMPESHIIRFSMMSYATQDVAIVPSRRHYDVQMTEKATKLNEVVIKAPSIRQKGDTVTYNVASFSSAGDKSLADVLKKMPGIEVSDKGEIKYNGTAINKFYIEGHDMLGSKYGLATNNIHYGDVGTVEVMENHQPIKALEDISFSQNPAINIRLKESAKSRWAGAVRIGGGINPGLWDGELTLMRFTKTTQSLNILKSNNAGADILGESSSLFPEGFAEPFPKSYKMNDYIDVSTDRLTDIDEERTRRNQSHAVTVNNLWSLGKSTDLSSVISYGYDRLLSDTRSTTSYLLPDSSIVIDENEAAKTKRHQLSVNLTLMQNTASHYLQNRLSADMDWNKADISTEGTYPNRQKASTPHYKIADNLEYLKRTGNKTYTLNSYNSYQVAPQSLDVSREGEQLRQATRSAAFYTNTNTSLGFTFHPVTVWLKTGIVAMHRTMRSEASGLLDSLGFAANKTSVTYFNLYASPVAELKTQGLNVRLEVPMAYAPYRYKNRLTKYKDTHHKLLVSPSFYLRHFLTSSLSASLSGQIVQSAVEEQAFHEGLIMTDYNRLSLGLVDYRADLRKSLSLGLSYKKPLQALFANVSATRSWTDYGQTTARSYTEDYVIFSRLPQKNTGRSWVVQGNVSKGIDFLKGLVSVTPMYIYMDGQLYQNDRLSPYASSTWMVTAKLKSKIARFCDVAYEVNYARDELTMKDSDASTSTNSLSGRLTVQMNFNKRFFVTLGGEHYNNKISDESRKRLFLCDASVAYSLKSGWEFSLAARNLFNEKNYAYTAYSNLLTMEKEYAIRPRSYLASIFFHF